MSDEPILNLWIFLYPFSLKALSFCLGLLARYHCQSATCYPNKNSFERSLRRFLLIKRLGNSTTRCNYLSFSGSFLFNSTHHSIIPVFQLRSEAELSSLGAAEEQQCQLFEPEGRVLALPGASLRFIVTL